MNRIAQSAPEALKLDFHYVPILELDTGSKTQAIGAKKVNVQITRPTMSLELEMMVLKILQAVAHFRLAGSESSGPERAALPFNLDLRGYR